MDVLEHVGRSDVPAPRDTLALSKLNRHLNNRVDPFAAARVLRQQLATIAKTGVLDSDLSPHRLSDEQIDKVATSLALYELLDKDDRKRVLNNTFGLPGSAVRLPSGGYDRDGTLRSPTVEILEKSRIKLDTLPAGLRDEIVDHLIGVGHALPIRLALNQTAPSHAPTQAPLENYQSRLLNALPQSTFVHSAADRCHRLDASQLEAVAFKMMDEYRKSPGGWGIEAVKKLAPVIGRLSDDVRESFLKAFVSSESLWDKEDRSAAIQGLCKALDPAANEAFCNGLVDAALQMGGGAPGNGAIAALCSVFDRFDTNKRLELWSAARNIPEPHDWAMAMAALGPAKLNLVKDGP